MRKASTEPLVCAGVDISKGKLDYAVAGAGRALSCANTAEGRSQLIAFLKGQGVRRVGLEASGGYEIEVVDDLRAAGFQVAVFQPNQVRAYGQFKRKRAKSDPIDAILIAECTAAQDQLRDPPDPRLAPFAEHLTFIEQIQEDIARAKTRRDRYRDPRLKGEIEDEIRKLTARKRQELRLLLKAVRAHADLARKLHLLFSIQGVGEPTALALVIRMPELGALSREEAACLLGVAPFVHESGRYKGQRRTGGGRARARTSLFAAALAAARQWNPALIALYDRLTAAGKPHHVAIIACVRKMIIFANTVLARNQPWEIRTADASR
jgi:transposase